jgi:restriction endonuclease S subunit
MRKLKQPIWLKPEEVPPLPEGWRAMPTEDACVQLKPGKLFENKTVSETGTVPVLNQSETDFLGYHDEEPGVDASPEKPVVTFANHTCAMRLMKQPFSTIQNIFPKIGKSGVTDTVYFYYASLGRIGLSDYKGHHPIFRQAHIPVPPMPDQRRIAGILSAYDELIENSQRRIRILETMARALYREWFVHFRFPGHEAHPRVPSPLRHIPNGWEVKKLGEVAEITMGLSPKGDTYNEEGDGTPLVNGPVEFGERFTKQVKWTTAATKFCKEGDLVVCVRGSTTGKYVKSDGVYCLGRGVCGLSSKYQCFVDLLFENELPTLLGQTSGSTFPSWTGPQLKNHPVLSPTPKLQARFEVLVKPMSDMVLGYSRKIQNLRRTRDLLLPRLLSDQIENIVCPTE